jgi:hypothetical protein
MHSNPAIPLLGFSVKSANYEIATGFALAMTDWERLHPSGSTLAMTVGQRAHVVAAPTGPPRRALPSLSERGN